MQEVEALQTDYRKYFADFENVTYLNVAYHGPLPLASARAGREALEWKTQPYRLPDSIHFDLPDRIRGKIAQIIGASGDEIAVTTGASSGLASVATSFDWKPGDEVLVGRGEFPAHFSTWLPYDRAGKLRMRVIAPRDRFITADDYIENIGPKTRLVSASLVRFDNAARLDAVRVAEACHAAGAMLLLDLSQCVGGMPISIRELGADFAVSSGYKWLLGPYGTGFFWVAREAAERLPLGPLYFMALEGARNFHTLPLDNLRAVPGAPRWDSPEPASFTNLAAFEASLDFVLQVGVNCIAQYIGTLVREIIRRLPPGRFTLASPEQSERRGPSICVAARTSEETANCFGRLQEAQVMVSLRENALRIAPHLYNTQDHISRLIDVLAA
jgi:cysteine desulfurase/selenocysteine lyase